MKPILFNTEMVRAILDGRKTVTRRAVKPHSPKACGFYVTHRKSDSEFTGVYDFDDDERMFDNPQVQPAYVGDILYVRETWALHSCNDRLPPSIPCEKTEMGRDCYIYRADATDGKTPCGVYPSPHLWRPSIHMPREAARLFLRVMGVRVERLHDMTANSAMDEGFTDWNDFVRCWDSTIKPAYRDIYGWAANPWVWVIEFERSTKEEDNNG